MFRGDLAIQDDPGQVVTHRVIDRYTDKIDADKLKEAWKNDDVVVIRLTPKSVLKVK